MGEVDRSQPGLTGARLLVLAATDARHDADQACLANAIEVSGVTADLLLALLSHSGELNAVRKGAVELHWGPNGVQGRLHPVWDHTLNGALVAKLTTRQQIAQARAGRAPRRRTGPRAVRDLGTEILITGTEAAPWD